MKNISVIPGAAAAALLWIAAAFSGSFASYPEGVEEMPVAKLTALLCAAGVLYLAAIWKARDEEAGTFAVVFAIGLLMRAAAFFAHPVLEDDYFRYLWDGAVAARGINPYAFSPAEAVSANAGDALLLLAQNSGGVAGRINHAELTTVYPPAAQAFFALSHLAGAWSVNVWRAVLLATDVATFLILRRVCRGRANPAIYWWNPLAVFTIFFSCHMEALILPFAAGAVWAAGKKRGVLAAFLLAVSVSVKLWTAVLAGTVARAAGGAAKKTFALLALCAGAAAVTTLPLFLYAFGENSGIAAYAESWENNSSFFRITLFLCKTAVEAAGFHTGHGQFAARVATCALIACGAVYASTSGRWQKADLAGRCLFISALVFLVIPTQFPWYYCWVVPFLAMRSGGAKWSLLALTALLPLYYLKYGAVTGAAADALVWIQFVPVWIMLVFENLRGNK